MSAPAPIQAKTPALDADLCWKRTSTGWRLFAGRRRFGDVIPNHKWPGMWRSVLSGGRLSDMANITWAKHAVVEAAARELEYEARCNAATEPRNCPENEGCFGRPAPPVRQIADCQC